MKSLLKLLNPFIWLWNWNSYAGHFHFYCEMEQRTGMKYPSYDFSQDIEYF